jgi:hypothetical protein
MLLVSGAVLFVIIGATTYFGFHPPDMSDKGLRHFRYGLFFAVVSSLLSLGFWLSAAHFKIHLPSSLLTVWVWAGNLSNVLAVFCFLRELVQVIPGVESRDVTPEGMILGSTLCFTQVLWILPSLSTAVW